jgi:uncharacterized protein (TIGR00369 family)
MSDRMNQIKAMAGGNGPPVARLIGIEVESVEPGKVTMSLEAGEQHWNPMGIVHGGIFCDLADAAMGLAFVTTLGEGEAFSTVELSVNYFRAVKTGKIFSTGTVVNAGKNVAYLEATVEDETGRMLAKVSSTVMVLRGEKAAERVPQFAKDSA